MDAAESGRSTDGGARSNPIDQSDLASSVGIIAVEDQKIDL